MKNPLAPKISDEQLIAFYKKGDQASMGDLYNRYSKKVHSKCYSYLKDEDEAFDLSQDILLKAFEKIHTFKGKSSFSTWLFSITSNHCIEYLRKQNKWRAKTLDDNFEMKDEVADQEEMELLDKKEGMIMALLNEIPSIDREMLILKYEKNTSVKEIQKLYELSASAVKMRLMRARKRISELTSASLIPYA